MGQEERRRKGELRQIGLPSGCDDFGIVAQRDYMDSCMTAAALQQGDARAVIGGPRLALASRC